MSIYDFKVKDSKGDIISLEDYKGKVLLIVNTATACGLTPQYQQLQELYSKYNEQGFEILDFPSNQFLNQAPGTDKEISDFCQLKYNTTFKTFSKIDVNGENAHPLYQYLKAKHNDDIEEEKTKDFLNVLKGLGQSIIGSSIKWNFTKFLVDKKGNIVGRFSPTFTPSQLEENIVKLLNKD